MFTKRVLKIKESQTFAIDAKVKNLLLEGQSVINLGLGEPDFDTPRVAKNEAVDAIKNGFTHYTSVQGSEDLRREISKKLQKENKISYDPSEILVGAGSKPLLFLAFQVLCEKGDEVIIPTPCWGSYVEQVKLSEAKPVLLKLKPPFKFTLSDLKRAFSSKTKVLVLNSPSNPTGAMIEKNELLKIADFVVKKNFWVLSDEIYEKITYGKKHFSIASFGKAIKERVITINGFSKTYAMTGWRIGYASGSQEVIKHMTALQGQIFSCAPSISQMASLAALTKNPKEISYMLKIFAKRREILLKNLSAIKKLKIIPPEGSFYFFIDVRKVLGKRLKTSGDFCKKLLDEEKVALTPGEAFYYKGFVRLSFTVSESSLLEAAKRLKRFVEKYA